jgi:hypothetical protein
MGVETLDSFAGYVAQLPSNLWTYLGAIASIVFGSWIGTRNALKIQRMQFELQSIERQTDRQIQMRREVYLPAVDAMVGVMGAIGRALDPKVGQEEITAAERAFSVSIARVQVVASKETIEAVSALQRAVLQQIVTFAAERFPLQLRQSSVDLAAKWMQIHQQEQSRLIEMMKAFNLAGERDMNRWAAIERQARDVEVQLEEVSERWRSLSAEQMSAQLELTRAWPARAIPIMKLQVRALTAIRNELEVGDASETLTTELDATNTLMSEHFERLMQLISEEQRRWEAAGAAD